MRTVAVANQKGGVGKTTTAVNVAAALGARGRRVLVLDLDPQGSASAWLGLEPSAGLLDAIEGKRTLAELPQATTAPGVEAIPAHPALANAERALAGEAGGEGVVRELVQSLPRSRFDVLLIDCPPSLGLLSLNALAAVSEAWAPVEARTMALAGLSSLLETAERVRRRLNPRLRVSAIIPCRVAARTNLARQALDVLRETWPGLVTEAVIRETVRLGEAPGFAQTIDRYDPHGRGAEDYARLAGELDRLPQKGRAS